MADLGEVTAVEKTPDGAQIRVDLGGGDVQTADHFAPAGVDSLPLVGDTAALVEAPGTGSVQAVGYDDPKNPGVAESGEGRIYARNAAGEPVCHVYCKGNAEIVIEVLKSSGARITIKTAEVVVIDAPDIRLGNEAGKPIAGVGDLVAVTIPQLLSSTPGNPCVPVPPTAVSATGGYVAIGQIISGSSVSKTK